MNVRVSVYIQEFRRSYRTEFGTMDPFDHFCGRSGRAASTPQPFHHCKEGKDRVPEQEPSDLKLFQIVALLLKALCILKVKTV